MKPSEFAAALDYEKFDDVMIEKKLFRQASVLDLMFLSAADSAVETSSPEMIVATVKLQEACRKTLLALHEIRHPKKPATFVKQLVQEQTNNQLIVNSEDIKPKQLGETNATPMDFRAEIEATGIDSKLATLDKIDGRKNSRRQGAKQQKRCEA